VPGTFFLIFGASVLFAEPFPPGGVTAEGHLFQRSGPASLTFDWCLQCLEPLPPVCGPGGCFFPPARVGAWQFESGIADIHPTPEPATLLLFGTTAAGLGLARWKQRRRKQETDAQIAL
jgi:hypothetical protein